MKPRTHILIVFIGIGAAWAGSLITGAGDDIETLPCAMVRPEAGAVELANDPGIWMDPVTGCRWQSEVPKP